MGCPYATFDFEEECYYCALSALRCVYDCPNQIRCINEYNEAFLKTETDKKGNNK